MVQLGNFNANEHNPSEFDLIPAGDYVVAITDSEQKLTKSGDGSYLQFTLQVLDGPAKGRKIWDRLNIDNPNPKAQQIGLGQLSAYCRACAKPNPQDTTELHDIPIKVRVKIEKGGDGYEDRNAVKSVLWKETTKPDLGAVTATKAAAFDDDDIPF